ncbi:MAG: TIGR03118 family protein, partial [Solirubrobacterales bacterium]
LPLTVSIPGGAPTGMVFNGSNGFVVHSRSSSGPASFLFSSEAGRITGWSQAVPPPPLSTQAQTAVRVPGAIFKGLAIANTATGPQIYATDFHNDRVDVWDSGFMRVNRPGAFKDPAIPNGFAPFGIETVNGNLVVTYAKQDADAEDDVRGPGNGFVDVYDTAGHLLKRLAQHGALNSPWGIAKAPQGFGPASGALLVGNFGNGQINAYDPATGKRLGALWAHGQRVRIPGLWALKFGNGVIGTPKSLLFTAGPAGESHGLFGKLLSASPSS